MNKKCYLRVLLLIIPVLLIAQTENKTESTDSPYYWEQRGLEDGKSSLGLKTTFAGAGGCVLGGVGGGLLGAPTLLTAGLPGSAGCIGGWGIGALLQQEPTVPTSESLKNQDAYMRGYKKGKSQSNTVSLIVGSGTTALAILATAMLWTYYYY